MHRPAEIAAVESVFDDLAEVLDEKPEVVRARLRDLVPEYADGTEGQPTATVRRTHAK
jgi:hypothetical protein